MTNSLLIVAILIYKIPPNLPLSKGGIIPLFGLRPIGPLARRAKRGEGRFSQLCLFNYEPPIKIESERKHETCGEKDKG
ncbi:MAG: hypothetical protein A2V86_13490 [Deltaproteobacteria bacterium RBG_16_49_23]|nr:MAG: hypothetical protein A2V86_13490 [Deltaproteobacteria bacterium RBG_16_49_23]